MQLTFKRSLVICNRCIYWNDILDMVMRCIQQFTKDIYHFQAIRILNNIHEMFVVLPH